MYNVDALVKDILGRDITLCRDYPSTVKWSVEHIANWTESWTDFNITDPGILFVNADAYLYDLVSYILDEAFLNNILRYTQSMQSLYFMSKFAGLTLPGYYCSTAKVSIHNGTDDWVTIPKDFEIYVRDDATNEVVYFYSLSSINIRNTFNGSLKFIEGKRVTVETTFEEFYNNSNFEFTIPTPEVGLNSIYVYGEYDFPADSSTIYYAKDPTLRQMLQVDDALLNLASEPCFSAYYAQTKVVIQLCPGAADFFNPDSRIVIVYGKPAGLNANVGQVKAKTSYGIMQGDTNVVSDLTFTIMYAAGATIPYDLEPTRVFIGNNVWRPETLILNADFDNMMVNKFPEIVRFTAVQNKGEEHMTVYFVPALTDAEGQPMSGARVNELKNEIYAYASELMYGGVTLTLENSKEVKMDFSLEVFLNINTSDTSAVHDAIVTILEDYFDRTKQERNMAFRRGRVITMLESGVDEIYYINMTYPVLDYRAADNEILVLGNVTTHFVQNDEFASDDWD